MHDYLKGQTYFTANAQATAIVVLSKSWSEEHVQLALRVSNLVVGIKLTHFFVLMWHTYF